jgi:hypothetical protein
MRRGAGPSIYDGEIAIAAPQSSGEDARSWIRTEGKSRFWPGTLKGVTTVARQNPGACAVAPSYQQLLAAEQFEKQGLLVRRKDDLLAEHGYGGPMDHLNRNGQGRIAA